MRNRDEMVLHTLISTTDEVAAFLVRCNCTSFAQFAEDDMLKRAITMCMISLSESIDLFTEDFKNRYNYIDFKIFKLLRNIAAHKYGSINFEMVWEIATKNLPKYNKIFKGMLETLARTA